LTAAPDPPTVLIVDDDARVRSFLRSALETDALVLEAADGEQACDLLGKHARHHLDLILVDYVLPGRSGLDVLSMTKRNWPWIPVVIITGFGSEALAVEALRAGANDYLRKPIQVGMLVEVVRALTASRAGRGLATPGDGSDEGRIAHPNIRRAVRFVREHFTEAITLTDVAREAALSRFHFCRLFHREAGVSFREYLHQLRVGRAKTLLADLHLTVTEVAYAVGFNDLSHFDRTFSRMAGRSPTQYRRSLAMLAGHHSPAPPRQPGS
jgi:YesN/AraC family two-component response regulator